MKVAEILSLLEDAINTNMEQFEALGQQAKTLLSEGEDPQKIYDIYKQMGVIVHELQPVRDMIEEAFPHYHKAFHTFLKVHENTSTIQDISFDEAQELCSFDK